MIWQGGAGLLRGRVRVVVWDRQGEVVALLVLLMWVK